MKILLVDDDPISNYLSEKILLEENTCGPIEVVAFTNPLAAVTFLFDLKDFNEWVILVDINMPMMNGIEFITTVRHLPLKTFVVLSSALSKDYMEVLKAFPGVRAAISKPLTKSMAHYIFELGSVNEQLNSI